MFSLRALFHKKHAEKEMDDEMRFHLEKQIEQNIARGMTPEDARYAALKTFGNVGTVKEDCRDTWGARFINELVQDVRYGLRQLRRNPGFTIIAVLTLALGIGANTAMFSVIDAVLLRPLPYAHPSQLVSVQQRIRHGVSSFVSYPNFSDWRSQNHVFSSMAAYRETNFTLTGSGGSVQLPGEIVTWEIFRLLGARPVLGRDFLQQEVQAGSHEVMISHRLWQSRFGSNPKIAGQIMNLGGTSYTICGVMPSGFQFPLSAEPAQLWTAIATDAAGKTPMTSERGARVFRVIARLSPGATLTQATAEMGVISRRLAKQYPEEDGNFKGIFIQSELDQVVGSIQLALMVLLGAVGFVLLIACANVASLLLNRGVARSKEMAVRSALGAGRRRIVRQLLAEGFLLSFCGMGLGLLVANLGTGILLRLSPTTIPRAAQAGLDGRVLLFTVILAFLTAVVFGVVPALQLSKSGLAEALKKGGRNNSEASRHRRLQNGLVIGETAAAFSLLAGAGLLILSYNTLQKTDPGFNPRQLLTFTFQLPRTRDSEMRKASINFDTQLLARLRQISGVRSASGVFPLPETDRWSLRFEIEGHPVDPSSRPAAGFVMAAPGYFQTMGIPILKGRGFSKTDDADAPSVTIVSQAFARRYFPNEDPVGKRIKTDAMRNGGQSAWCEIVGVVGDVRDRGLAGTPDPVYYVPYYQFPLSLDLTFVVRAQGNPRGLISFVRSQMASMEPNAPLYNVETMEQYLTLSAAQARFNAVLLAIFAGLALLLASVGLYGIISYSVSQRTHEIGVRMALGAERRDVMKMVVGQGLKLALAGVAIGIAGALAMTRFLSSLLYGVSATDPLTFAAVSLILIAVALLACYIPARRAAKVDPMVALRCE
jgi:putative ABC transport system permease protein